MINILHKTTAFSKTNNLHTHIYNKYKKHILGVDHIAFRSLYKGQNKFDMSIYEKKNEVYHFTEYNVKANEYYKINKNDETTYKYPLRIFSSYYVDDEKRENIKNIISSIENKEFGDVYSYNDYLNIYKWNQYVAWTMIHKDTINHIAYHVDDIERLTYQMIKDGFKFNSSQKGESNKKCINSLNDVINVSPDGNLLQSSILSDKKLYKFTDGYQVVPYTFVEFVERRNGREGFSEMNANNIMHSTKNV
jgi:hypothetical protein